jgi:ribosomal protein S18 acetylase RimI-like enzyme
MCDALTVRRAQPEDVERLVEIAIAAWEPIFLGFREQMGDELFVAMHPDWRSDKERQIRDACADPERVLVADLEGTVAGFVTFNTVKPLIGALSNNAVHPDYQGRGIAGRLYAAAFGCMRQAGIRYVRVGTGADPAHAPARRAYEKAGFTVSVPTVTYYRRL